MECSIKSTLCRLCLCCDDSASCIFEDNASDQYVVASLLRELLQFHVSENDGYPKLICSSCVKTITDFKMFKNDCLEAMATYDTEIRLHKSTIIKEERKDEETIQQEYSDSIIKQENYADTLDPYGNLLTKKEHYSSDEECLTEIPVGSLKEEPEDSEDMKNEDSFVEDELVEEIPIEIVEHPVKMEPADSIVNEDPILENLDVVHSVATNSLESMREGGCDLRLEGVEGANSNEPNPLVKCSVPVVDYESNGNEAILDVSTSVNLENICEPEASVSMYEGYEDNNLRIHERRGNIQESGNIKSSNVRLKKKSSRNPTLKKSYKSIANKGVVTKKENLGSDIKCYVCDICGKEASSKQIIAYHVQVHSGERPHKCKVCKKSFHNPSHLKSHENIHSGIKPYKCKSCHKTFTQQSTLVVHEKRHFGEKNYPCDLCSKRFFTKYELRIHQLFHKKDREFICSECGKGFTTKGTLKEHELRHKKEERFFCNECGKGFVMKGGLARHSRVHSGLKPFTCPVCNISFSERNKLKRHSTTHMKFKPIVCIVCNRYFRDSTELRNHKCIDNNEIVYSCTKCSSKFSQIQSLTTHKRQCKKRKK